MRILFTLHDLQYSGGTETFTYSLIKEFLRHNHEIFLYSTRIGQLADKYTEIGVFVTDEIASLPDNVDIIHAQHRAEAISVFYKYPSVPMIFTSHGIIPWQEKPVFIPSIVKYVAVSEEVQQHLIQNWDIQEDQISIIRNGIDQTRFHPRTPTNEKPESILLLSNRYTPDVKEILEEAANKASMKFNIVGQSHNNVWDVEDEILNSDVVVSLGRGILEAMSCGRLPLVFDYNGGDGIVTPDTYYDFRQKNFSGRVNNEKYTADQIIELIQKFYTREIIEANLELAVHFHDIRTIAEQYFELYKLGEQKRDSIVTIDPRIMEYLIEGYTFAGKEIVQKEKNLKYLLEVKKINEANEVRLNVSLTEMQAEQAKLMQEREEAVKQQAQLKSELGKTEATLMQAREEAMKQRAQLKSELETTETALNRDIVKLTQMATSKDIQIQNLEFEREGFLNQLDQKENNTKYLLELTREKDKELERIYSSRSWKLITKIKKYRGWVKKGIANPEWVIKKMTNRNQPLPAPIPIKIDVEHEVGDTPQISVVIPVYDRTDVLRQSIDSILNQTYQNYELIIVCDGSPAETLKIVDEYVDHEKVRIFKYYNNSGNAVRGRNKAIREARGEFLAFQDSDDIAELNRLEISLNYINEFKADVVYGGWRALVDGSRMIDIKDGQEVLSPDCGYDELLKMCVPCQSTVMLRLDAVRAVGGLKTKMRYREDHELWLRMAYKGYKFKSIPLMLTNLRLHSNNLELSFKDDDNRWFNLMLEEHKNIIEMKPKIAYLIPGCGISGGIAVVCQHANRLLNRGYDVLLITEDNHREINWFPNQKVEIIGVDEAPANLDILVATGWSTAYTIAYIPAKRKVYFVQSDESRFYPAGSIESQKAWDSYKFDYEYMTEAKWIQKWLKEKFGHNATYVPNGLDENIIFQTDPITKKGDKVRVLLEGPIDIPFKGMEDAFNAINDLDCEVWCVSSAGKPKKEWKCDVFFEKVPMSQMNQIYSSCDILVKLSRVEGFFGPPLEMMACGGTCVVADVTGHDEYIVDNYNALVVKIGDVEGAKQAVKKLIEDTELRQRLIANGRKTAEEWRWEPSIDTLEELYYKNHSIGKVEV
ncbi:glycosyltransferase [Paenibacillus sp. JNUCC31]|uniref:glycosyltransferase n=1 Tax=Paenibacillus sp. JNUCC-31 TaxID=2777983 RepID=UPI00177B12E3|nr:glycosyltransferase [Paenibacillus sp. JNUCC-31]QOS81362.1 glycosyltransferase [Paenibacillus sp. JNUCC-31]